MSDFDQLKDSEVFKNTTVLIKEGYAKTNEFLAKPKVKDKIKKAKRTTIDLAEKGVAGLKKVLEDKEEPNKQKTCHKKVYNKNKENNQIE